MSLETLTDAQRRLVTETGALLKGHFVLASGRHSEFYFQCALLLQHPAKIEPICAELAASIPRADEIETVVSPAIGGIVFGQEMARALGCRSIFAEKQDGEMVLRRGFSLRPGEKVLLAEDVVTTGGSVKKVAALAREAGAEVVGFVALVDRSAGAFDGGAPLASWARLEFPTYAPDEVPETLAALPVEKPGSGQGTRKG